MKTAFWNVDTQYDFMRPEGALYVQGAEKIEGNLAKLTKFAREKGIKIINTADRHNEKTEEIAFPPGKADFINTFPPHCMEGTKGAQFIPATEPDNPYIIDWKGTGFDAEKIKAAKEVVMYKDKFGIFAGNKYADAITNLIVPEQVIAYGVATNVCVNQAVLGLLERKRNVFVVEDAIKELPIPGLEKILGAWTAQGAKLIKTNEIARYL